MERVAELLRSNKLREALVRLWTLAGDLPQLSEWERNRQAGSFDDDVKEMLAFLQEERTPSAATLQQKPLVLIRALDIFLTTIHHHSPRHR